MAFLSNGANAMETYERPTKLLSWPEKDRRNKNKRRLSDTTLSPQKNSNGRKQGDELLNCKHVLLFIKRKDDLKSETKYPEDRTKSHEELFGPYKLIKKVPFAS